MPIAIVTKNLIFGEILSRTCERGNIRVDGVFGAVSEINRLDPDDLLLVHLRADDATIIQQLEDVRQRHGDLVLVFLVSDQLSTDLRYEIEGIAAIVVTESEPADALISALTLAELGYHLSALSGQPKTQEVEQPEPNLSSGSKLSRREVTILGRLCEGMSNKSIALDLGIRETTVKVHLRSTYRKIGVSNRTQAALWASREFPDGLVRQASMD